MPGEDSSEAENIETILQDLAGEIDDLDQNVIGETLGLRQAIDQLRTALDKIDKAVDDRNFQEASAIGYKDAASAFVFLQRTLAGVQQLEHDKVELIQKAALRYTKIYEDAAPFVEERLENFKPKA